MQPFSGRCESQSPADVFSLRHLCRKRCRQYKAYQSEQSSRTTNEYESSMCASQPLPPSSPSPLISLYYYASCARLGLTPLAYLWERSQPELLREMVEAGMESVLVKVAGAGCVESFAPAETNELDGTIADGCGHRRGTGCRSSISASRSRRWNRLYIVWSVASLPSDLFRMLTLPCRRTSATSYMSAEKEANTRLLRSTARSSSVASTCKPSDFPVLFLRAGLISCAYSQRQVHPPRL